MLAPTGTTVLRVMLEPDTFKLARAHGYNRKSPSLALKQPWPRMEQIIADAIGVDPHQLWPSRYGTDGKSNRRVGRPSVGHVDNDNSKEEVKLQKECEIAEGKSRKRTNYV